MPEGILQGTCPAPPGRVHSYSLAVSLGLQMNMFPGGQQLKTSSLFLLKRAYLSDLLGMHQGVRAKLFQSCPTLCDPMDRSPPGSSVHGFSRQEYWSELPCPPPGDLPDPRIKPMSLVSCIGRQVLYQWHHLGSSLLGLHQGIAFP